MVPQWRIDPVLPVHGGAVSEQSSVAVTGAPVGGAVAAERLPRVVS